MSATESEELPEIIHEERFAQLQKNIVQAKEANKPSLNADIEQFIKRYMESMSLSLKKVPDDGDVQVVEHLMKKETLTLAEASAIEDLLIAGDSNRMKRIMDPSSMMMPMFPFFVPFVPPRAADPQEFAAETSDEHKDIFRKLEKRLTRSIVVRPCGLHLTHKEAYQSAQAHYNETGASLLGGNATYKSYMYVVGSQRRFRVAKAGKEGDLYWYVSEPRDNWQQVIRSAEYDNGFMPLPNFPAVPNMPSADGEENTSGETPAPIMPTMMPNGENMTMPQQFSNMMTAMMTMMNQNMANAATAATAPTTEETVTGAAEAVAAAAAVAAATTETKEAEEDLGQPVETLAGEVAEEVAGTARRAKKTRGKPTTPTRNKKRRK